MQSVKRIKRIYYLVTFLFWLATALPASLLVLIIQARGIDLFQIGILAGTYALTTVLLEAPTGGLADAIGRKRVTILAYSCIAISSLIYLFAFSFTAFLVGYIVYGIGRALASGALDAWFIDALQAAEPDIELQPALAQAETVSFLALGIGTLAGGFIPGLFPDLPAEGTAAITPFSINLLLSFLLKVVVLLLAFTGVQEERPPLRGADWTRGLYQVPAIMGDAFNLSRRNPTIVLLLGASLISGLVLAGLETFWQPHFAGLLGDSQEKSLFFGVIMAGNFIVGMAGNMMASLLSRLFKRRYGLLAALFQGIRGLMLVLLALQTTATAATALFWLVYLNMGIINSPHATLVNQELPSERRSSMLSVQSLAFYLGSVLGSTGLGYLAQHGSIPIAWLVEGVVAMLSLGLYLKVDFRRELQQRSTVQNDNKFSAPKAHPL